MMTSLSSEPHPAGPSPMSQRKKVSAGSLTYLLICLFPYWVCLGCRHISETITAAREVIVLPGLHDPTPLHAASCTQSRGESDSPGGNWGSFPANETEWLLVCKSKRHHHRLGEEALSQDMLRK